MRKLPSKMDPFAKASEPPLFKFFSNLVEIQALIEFLFSLKVLSLASYEFMNNF